MPAEQGLAVPCHPGWIYLQCTDMSSLLFPIFSCDNHALSQDTQARFAKSFVFLRNKEHTVMSVLTEKESPRGRGRVAMIMHM